MRTVEAGGMFGYRFHFPAMRVGTHEVYWHRPLAAYRCPDKQAADVLARRPARLFHGLSDRSRAAAEDVRPRSRRLRTSLPAQPRSPGKAGRTVAAAAPAAAAAGDVAAVPSARQAVPPRPATSASCSTPFTCAATAAARAASPGNLLTLGPRRNARALAGSRCRASLADGVQAPDRTGEQTAAAPPGRQSARVADLSPHGHGALSR